MRDKIYIGIVIFLVLVCLAMITGALWGWHEALEVVFRPESPQIETVDKMIGRQL